MVEVHVRKSMLPQISFFFFYHGFPMLSCLLVFYLNIFEYEAILKLYPYTTLIKKQIKFRNEIQILPNQTVQINNFMCQVMLFSKNKMLAHLMPVATTNNILSSSCLYYYLFCCNDSVFPTLFFI